MLRMERQILRFHVPSFGIALARAEDASLNDRPVALAPMHTLRARLCEVSHEALAEGLSPGMPVRVAPPGKAPASAPGVPAGPGAPAAPGGGAKNG